MKNKKLIIFLVFVMIFLAIPIFASNKNVKLASITYPPYSGPEIENHRFVTEIIESSFERKNYSVSVDFMLWSEALNKTKSGEYDGIYTLWYRKDREEWFSYSNPFVPNEVVVCKDSSTDLNFQDYQDLEGNVVGVVKDYTYPEEFYNYNYTIKEYKNDKELLGKLFSGEVDVVPIDRGQAIYITKQEYPDKIDSLVCLEDAI